MTDESCSQAITALHRLLDLDERFPHHEPHTLDEIRQHWGLSAEELECAVWHWIRDGRLMVAWYPIGCEGEEIFVVPVD